MEMALIVSPADIKLGLIITIVGMGVVFSALFLLTVIFNQIPRILKIQLKRKVRKAGKPVSEEDCCPDISGDTNAAIATAIYLYFSELHDNESNIMTIEKVSKRYSPWSSKIYGLRNFHIR
jgi:Na+-transporting methylmalonyl-CoA/oxaloacetate decarboxylase gamma subunit